MLVIKKAEFIKSAKGSAGFFRDGRKQIAVAGKSNVGKSTFINFIANRKGLARTSNTPGRTQLINYFDLGEFILTDLPGYGFAKVSREEANSWGTLIDSYLLTEPDLMGVILLLDIRHDPTQQDRQLVEYLYYHRIPFYLIATKADKLSRMQQKLHVKKIADTLGVGASDIFAVSSLEKIGKEKALELLERILSTDFSYEEEEESEDEEGDN
ncbi:MAG: YihA family ribosome biogenesis GTP-binding protein [Clostridia bacterium]|nr:YihA family ribosome biogenesis GTP-binding protein [Clostridia bacterium]